MRITNAHITRRCRPLVELGFIVVLLLFTIITTLLLGAVSSGLLRV